MQKQKPGLLLWKVISTQLRGKVNQLMALISNLFMSSPHCPRGALQRRCSSLCTDCSAWPRRGLQLDVAAGFKPPLSRFDAPCSGQKHPFFLVKMGLGSILSTLSCLVRRTSVAEPVPGHVSCNCTNFSYFPHSIAPLATWGISPSATHFISLCLCSKQEFNISWSTVSVCNKVSRECDF